MSSGQVLVVGGSAEDEDAASAELYDTATGTWSLTGFLAAPRAYHTATRLLSGQVLVVGGSAKEGDDLASAELYDPATGTWSLTDSLIEARDSHTATLLPSGQVLVVAGNQGQVPRTTPLASAELFDPATGTWSTTGSLSEGRDGGHTATLLHSGQVLVVGGNVGLGSLASAELYDPDIGVWSPAGSLRQVRALHTATLLPTGQVLVVGGLVGFDGLASAELYEPDTGTWSAAGLPADARGLHSAVLLPSGKVLVAGGARGATRISSAELYDPANGKWSAAGLLAEARVAHTATLLPSGRVLVAAGSARLGTSFTAELYDPGDGLWSATDALAEARWLHTATLLPSGRVLVAGGLGDHAEGFWTAELYEPTTGTWSATGSLTEARRLHAATLLPSGQVLAVGGLGGEGKLATAELYDPTTGVWSLTGSLAEPRADHSSTLLPSGKVLVAGGVGEVAKLATAELYDPSTGTWLPTGTMRKARSLHTATLLLSGKVLVTGDVFGSRSAELYDTSTGTWSATGSLLESHLLPTATLLPSGQVLVVGSAGVSPSAELYDPSTGIWVFTTPLGEIRSLHTATLLLSGQVLVAGGSPGSGLLSSAELYDHPSGTWSTTGSLVEAGANHTATLLSSGRVLIVGGDAGAEGAERITGRAELYDLGNAPPSRRPVLTGSLQALRYDAPIRLDGTALGGDSEASGGGRGTNSPANLPLVQLRALEGGAQTWLRPDELPAFCVASPSGDLGFCDDWETTLTVSEIPPIFGPGWHLVSVFSSGVPSESLIAPFECSLGFHLQPQDQRVAIGQQATFRVGVQGARQFQWQQCLGDSSRCLEGSPPGVPSGWVDIPGATAASYTTPPVNGPESGTKFRGLAANFCMPPVPSAVAILAVEDDVSPQVVVRSPAGGEFWLLSEPEEPPNTELVTWEMSDDVRICRVRASLRVSTDGGGSFAEVTELGSFGPGGTCVRAETTTSVSYDVPASFDGLGGAGALYKVRVEVSDHSGNSALAESERPFFIVRPNPDAVKTLILSNTARMVLRMGITVQEAAELDVRLQELAAHPRVQGRVVDLDGVTSLAPLYEGWDGEISDANDILFAAGGLHDHLRDLLRIFTGVKYLVLVGDDRIIPLARLPDRTALLTERDYPLGGDITPTTTVGQALAANQYLSDDPLAVLDRARPGDLGSNLFLPDLAVGRLVEEPEEIVRAIATYISQDGVLDLSALDPETGHKVLVTGYDFLLDAGVVIRERWRSVLGDVDEINPPLAPVDGELLTPTWGEPSVDGRRQVLREHLCGNAGPPYSVNSLSGHATHFELGVPGTDRFDIQGLPARDLGAPNACNRELGLAGGIVYAVGCHSGLPVPGNDPDDADHSLDLPQTMMGRGVLGYVANTGYGWGLLHGIGYGERLVQILTEELTAGGTVILGDAVKRTKLRYFLENPRFEPFDAKSLMQWTLFGLPMYAVRTGIDVGDDGVLSTHIKMFTGPAPKAEDLLGVDRNGPVTVTRRLSGDLTAASAAPSMAPKVELPPFLTRLEQRFDFTAPGVYVKRNALGEVLPDEPGCPPPALGEPLGCYYTLNGLVERATGETDQPLQPYFIFDSRLSGTSQHGVLWLGGEYGEERGWVPVVAELASNGGDFSDHGATPLRRPGRPTAPRVVLGEDPNACRQSDLEVNSLVVPAGEVLKERNSDPFFDIQRRYRTIDLEVFYFNNTLNAEGNCDRIGPELGEGPFGGAYHRVSGRTIEWSVPASDAETDVWRVVLVTNTDILDGQGRGRWVPLDLEGDGSGTWRGTLTLPTSFERLTYVVQTVDIRGNVTWLDFVAADAPQGSEALPASGVEPEIPLPVVVELGGACAGGPTILCLNDNRFQVEVEWLDFQGNTGSGRVVRFRSDHSGLFWFFEEDNWEMLVKVLDGCTFNDHFWIFAAASTNVGYTLRVTDTQTAAIAEYFNPLGHGASAIADTRALAVCPPVVPLLSPTRNTTK